MLRTRTVALIAGAILVALPSAVRAAGAPAGSSARTPTQTRSAACGPTSPTGFVIPLGKGRQSDVGFYLGGVNAKCALSTLHPKTASRWINEQLSRRRSLAPLWVGPQAPCAKGYSSSIDAKSRNNARREGEDEADAAVTAASQLGLGKGSIIYYDIGNYNQSKSSCQGAVAAFLGGWDYEIHSRGYKAGVYTGAAAAKAVRTSLRILIPELQPDNILVTK